ncbi:MAG: MBL fold metallo-hydrolase [Brevinema sp.]
MKLTFLGTGTSSGVPIIGCACSVCLSKDPRDTRLRCVALLSIQNRYILIDAGPDIRQQLLKNRIQSLDAVLVTHSHFDHIAGLDELRPLSWAHHLELFTDSHTMSDIKRMFPYIFDQTNLQLGGGITRFYDHIISHYQEFNLQGISILPLLVMHGRLAITGYKIGGLAYLTDVKTLPLETITAIQGIDTLVLDCLRIAFHPTHINLTEALNLIQLIQPKKTYFIHMDHELSHQEWEELIPGHVAYDGLEIFIPEDTY